MGSGGQAQFPDDNGAALLHVVHVDPGTDRRPAMHDHMRPIRRIDRDIVCREFGARDVRKRCSGFLPPYVCHTGRQRLTGKLRGLRTHPDIRLGDPDTNPDDRGQQEQKDKPGGEQLLALWIKDRSEPDQCRERQEQPKRISPCRDQRPAGDNADDRHDREWAECEHCDIAAGESIDLRLRTLNGGASRE